MLGKQASVAGMFSAHENGLPLGEEDFVREPKQPRKGQPPLERPEVPAAPLAPVLAPTVAADTCRAGHT